MSPVVVLGENDDEDGDGDGDQERNNESRDEEDLDGSDTRSWGETVETETEGDM
ncbi:hypothetical protein HK104_007476, partial [Borealophlyctis nickersoniae]